MRDTIEKLLRGETLMEKEAYELILHMLNGRVSDEQIAAILSILRFRGETVDEIVGFAKGMQETARNICPAFPVLDTCGTGGDGSRTFNISTSVAILLSALNIPVAKHGNRRVSSKTGSADVLECLNIPIQTTHYEALEFLTEMNLCFLFAPNYHSAMRHVGKARQELGVKTIFNLLGPLTNPAKATRQLIGVYDLAQGRKMAKAAARLGIERAMFVTGEDGLDELTITGKSYVVEVNAGKIHEYSLEPEDVGLTKGSLEPLIVDSPADSAALIKSIFRSEGPIEGENIVLLNAGAAMYVYGTVGTIAEGVHEARKGLGETVLKQLERLNKFVSKKHSGQDREKGKSVTNQMGNGRNEEFEGRGEQAL